MDAQTSEENPLHAPFLDRCILYSDFNRPVFLEAIVRWFVESAELEELRTLRRAIRDQAENLRRGGKRGRPNAAESWRWVCRAVNIVWQKEILGRTWREIAECAGIRPTKPNIRTLQRQRDKYAEMVWRATQGGSDPKALSKTLESKLIQRWYRSKVALPFDTHPEECKRIVLKLAPRGLVVAGAALGTSTRKLA